MPIELRIHTTRPLDDDVFADRIVEWTDQDSRASRAGCADRRIHIGYQIARSLHAKRIRNRCLEPEHRHGPYRRQHQLRHGAARSWRHSEYALLGGCAAESGEKTRDEAVEVLRRDIDVGGIELWPHGHVRRLRGGIDHSRGTNWNQP